MGKTLDALFGRSFKASKFKALLNFAISRLAVLKNQKQARCSLARSDVVQLLLLSEQERALIRVEQVIKEQNMLDVFAMIEGYCILLSERIKLIELEKDCPDELKEAISSLVYASSRCGDFPELQQIRSVFASRYGKEFTLRAIELRNNCGVNSKIIQKLSTRQPSFESRIKALKQLADENGINLQLEETISTAEEGKQDKEHSRIAKNLSVGSRANSGDDVKDLPEELSRVESLSISMNRRKQYKDVAEAAQDAYLSAAYATAAARAAVDLFRSTSGGPPDNLNNSNNDHRKHASNNRSEEKSGSEASERKFSWEIEDSDLSHHTIHPDRAEASERKFSWEIEDSDLSHRTIHPDGAEASERKFSWEIEDSDLSHHTIHPDGAEASERKFSWEIEDSDLSHHTIHPDGAEASERKFSWEIEDSDLSHHTIHPNDYQDITSDENNEETDQSEEIINIKHIGLRSNTPDIASGVLGKKKQNLRFDESDDDAQSEKVNTLGNKEESREKGAKLLHDSNNQTVSSFDTVYRKYNDEQISTGLPNSQRLNKMKRPFSVRTRR